MTSVMTHLGLGDHLLTNGLLRSLSEKYGPLTTWCKPHNVETVRFMYRDVPITVKPVVGNERPDINIGFPDRGIPFDQAFYKQAGIPFKARWDKFHVERCKWREKNLEDRIKPPGRFALVHHDTIRGMCIDIDRIDPKLLILPLERKWTDNLFDWMGIIERATELHLIESSVGFLADSMTLTRPVYFHRYARPLTPDVTPTYRNKRVIWEA